MPSPEQPFMFGVNYSFGAGSVFTEISNEGAGFIPPPSGNQMILENGDYMITETSLDNMITE
jgi:hypothetical protein